MCDAYKDFNHATKHFVRDLMNSYPDMKEFKILHMAYKITKSFNKKAPQKYLHDLVLDRCKAQIMRQDESLFDMSGIDTSDLPLPARLLLSELSNIKEIWTSLDEKDKDAVWKHLKVLTVLSNRCNDS